MTHVITALCLRDGACVDVCPVECIVGGKPENEWPWFFIDPATCIDCGACVPECPFEAIFPEDEVPAAFTLKTGKQLQRIGAELWTATEDVEVDLTEGAAWNAAFYTQGPGYGARNM